jgi:hypothetical protein
MELPSPGDVLTTESAAQVNAPTTMSGAQEDAVRTEAIKNLNSLEEAYRYELKFVKDKVDGLKAKVDDLDGQLYDLRKRLKGIEQYPTIAVHGLGRAFGKFEEVDGLSPTGYRSTNGYLDLQPFGTISKEVRWVPPSCPMTPRPWSCVGSPWTSIRRGSRPRSGISTSPTLP